jgi:ADP-ribose pyrophosphatase
MHGNDARLHWKELSRRRIASCGVFDLESSRRSSPEGKTGEFSILLAPDWVNVVPVLRMPSGEEGFVLVRQYRHGAERITTEFPAGMIEAGEDPADAARRELLEETGYRAGRLSPLGDVLPNPAFMANRCFVFLAEDLSARGSQALDSLESLDAVILPLRDVEEGIGTGELVNSLMLVAFLLFQRHRARHA